MAGGSCSVTYAHEAEDVYAKANVDRRKHPHKNLANVGRMYLREMNYDEEEIVREAFRQLVRNL